MSDPTTTANPFQDDDDRVLSKAEVKALTGMSKTTQWRERKAGRFPPLLPPTMKNTLGQIRQWNRERRAEAEKRQKEQAKPAPTPSRGRPRKVEPENIAAE